MKRHSNQSGFVLGAFVLEFIQSIVLALSVFVLLYLFIAQPNEVKGNSMLPNFTNGEFLLTDKLSYYFSKPERGDVVVFKAPKTETCAENECEYIKRILGVPGDKVMVKDGKIYLNGNVLKESYLPDTFVTESGAYLTEGVEKTVPEGYYLCIGDNRSHSRDGREFGPIEKDDIVGKAFFKYWPVGSIGLVPKIRI